MKNIDLPTKYVLISQKAEKVFEVAPGIFVREKHVLEFDNYQYVADTKDDIYYMRFLDCARDKGLDSAKTYHRRNPCIDKMISRLKREHPDLCI